MCLNFLVLCVEKESSKVNPGVAGSELALGGFGIDLSSSSIVSIRKELAAVMNK